MVIFVMITFKRTYKTIIKKWEIVLALKKGWWIGTQEIVSETFIIISLIFWVFFWVLDFFVLTEIFYRSFIF